MKSTLTKALASAALVITTAFPVLAHHSFSAEFDAKKPVKLEGKVAKMEWVNPHSWLHLDVTKPDGTTERWMVEGGSPGVMFRAGWNKNSLPPGTKVIVTGSAAKDGSLRANSRSIEFPDGRKLDTGSSQGKAE